MARAVGRSRQPLREACGGWAKRKHDARPDTPLTESVRSTYSSGRAFHFLKPLGSSHTPSSRPDQAMRPNQNKARASDEREQERRRPDSDDRDERRMQGRSFRSSIRERSHQPSYVRLLAIASFSCLTGVAPAQR